MRPISKGGAEERWDPANTLLAGHDGDEGVETVFVDAIYICTGQEGPCESEIVARQGCREQGLVLGVGGGEVVWTCSHVRIT